MISKTFDRPTNRPLLEPIAKHAWEAKAVFNPGAIEIDGTIYILYRAMSKENVSSIGLATTKDGIHIKERVATPIYTPRADFESKKNPDDNSGCEDPRLTRIGDTLYMTYTAYNGVDVPRIALTSISVVDFINQEWNWATPVIVSPERLDDKDGVLFPEKVVVDGKKMYALIHRVAHNICIDYSDTPEFKNHNEFKDKVILKPRKGMWDSWKVGIAGIPFLTETGWIMLYHGVDNDQIYKIGAVLLDKNNPEKVLARTRAVLFEPEASYELLGQVDLVVFPCGSVLRDGMLYIYYGGGDRVVSVATMSISDLNQAVLS